MFNNIDGLKIDKHSLLYENLNEGLIRSYSIDAVKKYLEDAIHFPCISSIYILDRNPYFAKNKQYSKDEFVKIVLSSDLNSILAYKTIIKTCFNLFGWFTRIVDVKVKIRNKPGFIPIYFYRGIPYGFKDMHDFEDCFFAEKEGLELDEFIKRNLNRIYSVSLIIEGKFSQEYLYDNADEFYHEVDKRFLDKILKNGLVSKSRFNYPDRIYLSTDIGDLDNVELKNDKVILNVRLKHKQKLYFDPRSNGLFTYDNIFPEEIIKIS